MTDDLFFIPIIAAALRAEDRDIALQDAFKRIEEQGKQPRYRIGLAQFERLMQVVREQGQIVLLVEREGDPVGTIRIDPDGGPGRLGGIVPGRYSVSLSTGRLLWEGELGEADLLWARAFPGQPLAMAAATGRIPQPRSRNEILEGGLALSVLPGVEAGEIAIQMDENASANNG